MTTCNANLPKRIEITPQNISQILWRIQAESKRNLPTSTKEKLEQLFATSLERIELHDGPLANLLCRRSAAKAVTWGNHIAFQNRSVSWQSRESVSILAHEIAHFVQRQKSHNPPFNSLPTHFGSRFDESEREAESAAAAVCADLPIPKLSADGNWCLRKNIDIDLSSASVSINPEGANLAFAAGNKFAAFHLTQGFTNADDPNFPLSLSKAFTFSARVVVRVDTLQEADDVLNGNWAFNFIQIAKENQLDLRWEGRTKFEGEVEMIIARPPAWPQAQLISLDSLPNRTPFVQTAKHIGIRKRSQPGQRIELEVSHTMGDHPAIRTLLKFPNRATRTRNFLQDVQIDQQYTSVFVARNPLRTIVPLAHVDWRIAGHGTLKWRGGKPDVRLRSGQISFEQPVSGTPRDSTIASLVVNPVSPFSTDAINDAINKAALEKLNTTFSPTRTSLFVPKDFFT